MKSLVFMLIAATVSSEQLQPTFSDIRKIWVDAANPHEKDCQTKTGVSNALRQRVLEHGEFVNDSKLKCYMNCLYEKMRVVDSAGRLQDSGLMKLANVSTLYKAEDVVKKCKRVQTTKPCDTSFLASRCVYYAVKQAVEKPTQKQS